MLWKCTHGGGNLLLNVGPDPYTGRIHELEVERLAVVGKWLAHNGEAIYGPNDRPETLDELKDNAGGKWTRHGYDAYLWLPKWPAKDIVINSPLKSITMIFRCNI
jgi:alpha-L-fucosidase